MALPRKTHGAHDVTVGSGIETRVDGLGRSTAGVAAGAVGSGRRRLCAGRATSSCGSSEGWRADLARNRYFREACRRSAQSAPSATSVRVARAAFGIPRTHTENY